MTDDSTVVPPAPERPEVRSRRWWTIIVVTGSILVVGLWIVATKLPVWLTQPTSSDNPSTASTTGDARRIRATLFYVNQNGSMLVAGNRQVAYGGTPADQARRIVEAQVAAPTEGAKSAIPAGTTVL